MADSSRREIKIQPQMMVGVSAILVGVCALAVSLYETRLMREEQRAAVIPLMELSRSYYQGKVDAPEKTSRLLLQAENVGIGPARIMDFHVTVDGVPKNSWNVAMQALIGRNEPIAYGQSTINGRTIPPDRSVTMFNLSDTHLTGDIIAEFDRLDFEACFCSIFNECWTTSYSTFGGSRLVETCQRDDNSFME